MKGKAWTSAELNRLKIMKLDGLPHTVIAERLGHCSHCEQRRTEIKNAIRTFEARANANDGRLDANEVLRELEFLNKTY